MSVEGVPAVWFIPQNSPQDKALLYLHGGGFIFGLSQPHLEMVAYLAQKLGLRTLVVDYCLAPEHPYPAPLDDCVTAYRWLLKQGLSARNIVVAGDSAGGNLTITMLMKLRDCGDRLPAAAACLSPVGTSPGTATLQGSRTRCCLPAPWKSTTSRMWRTMIRASP